MILDATLAALHYLSIVLLVVFLSAEAVLYWLMPEIRRRFSTQGGAVNSP